MRVRGGVAALALLASAGASSAQVAWMSEVDGDHEAIMAITQTRALAQRVTDAERAVAADRLTAARAMDRPRRMVVEFATPPTRAEREGLAAAGVRLLDALGGGSYFATVDPGSLNVAAVTAASDLVSIEDVRREWKLHPLLLDAEAPEGVVIRRIGDEETGEPVLAAYVKVFGDAELAAGRALVEAGGGRVVNVARTIGTLVVEMPAEALKALASEDVIQWVEPALPALTPNNAESRELTQAEELQAAPYGLSGAGVSVMVYDSGIARDSHVDFGGRLTLRDTGGFDFHSTHVAGTVGGDGAASSGANRGIAPGALIDSYAFDASFFSQFLYTDPGDLESSYTDAFVNRGNDVSNNSIGTNTEFNGSLFPCSVQGDYSTTSSLIDSIIDGALGVPVRIVWAGGNERGGSDCDVEGFGDYYSSAPPSGAKNSIVVGAVNAEDDSMTSFSSWGPVDDGRLRPDVVGPGCRITANGIVSPGSGSDSEYIALCGTSMAAPAVAGVVALLLEDWRAQFPADPDPSNAMVKALLIHTAADLGNTGPDYRHGYGSVRAKDAVDHLRRGSQVEETIEQGGQYTAQIEVAPGDASVKATLAWDDAPGAPNSAVNLVNDLDLTLISPSGEVFTPWELNPLNPGAPAVRHGAADRRNNVEQVEVQDPEPGSWTVAVNGFNVPAGPETFSLTTTPDVRIVSLSLALASELPDLLPPNEAIETRLTVSPSNQTLIEGTAKVLYRYEDGAFTEVALEDAGGGSFEATLPVAVCGDVPEFYFVAEGSETGVNTLPFGAPSVVFSRAVGSIDVPFEDDAESNLGWQLGVPGDTAGTGQWERADPEGTAAQPEDDTTVDGTLCFVTGASAGTGLGDFDIDDGVTTLVSPAFDLSGSIDPTLRYNRWFSNNTGAAPGEDVLRVDISDDDGSTWVSAEIVGPTGPGTTGGWVPVELRVLDFVSLTSTVRLRFIAGDEINGSLVEAAIDDVRVDEVSCLVAPPLCPGDINGDNRVDLDDFSVLAVNFGASPATREQGDLDGNNVVDLDDFSALAVGFGTVCGG